MSISTRTLALFSILLMAIVNVRALTPQERLDAAVESLATAKTDEKKFYALNDAAKQSFEVGKIDDARKYAQDLLTLLPHFENNWNYGNAMQDANLVLGRIAAREDRLDDAGEFLIKAGSGPGSPQMNSFGPNMSLAKDLLEKGQKEVVLRYFVLCRSFWKLDHGKLEQWKKTVEEDRIPNFGANLVF